MRFIFLKSVLNAIAVPNPTRYTKTNKYDVKTTIVNCQKYVCVYNMSMFSTYTYIGMWCHLGWRGVARESQSSYFGFPVRTEVLIC